MKFSIALTTIAALTAKISATCVTEKLGYPCCTTTNDVVFVDADGEWGIENGNWCYEPMGKQVKVEDNKFTGSGNPFDDSILYVNPSYSDKVDAAISQMSDESLIPKALNLKEFSNAIWLNSIDDVNNLLEQNLNISSEIQAAQEKKVVNVFVLNNLPGRDCSALFSDGELQANDSDFERYLSEYVDAIESVLKQHQDQNVVLIVEPSAISSLAADLAYVPACQDAAKYYKNGLIYIVKKLGVLPNTSLYLDIGNPYNLGWEDTREAAVNVISEVLKSGYPGINRGFATNVGKYVPWESQNEIPELEIKDVKSYVEVIHNDLIAAGVKYANFIVDTSRNGQEAALIDPNTPCNEKTVSVGPRPQANPIPEMPYVDAFYWVKPLGESDGNSDLFITEDKCLRNAPEAGEWFQEQFELGIKNANPPL